MTKIIIVLAFIIPNFASASYWGELNQAPHKFLASPTGASGTMSARVIDPTDVPTLNQNTSGTAANLSGTPALPNGVTATTQAASDNSTKLATTAYTDSASSNASVIGKVLTGFSAGAGVVAATDTILQAFNKIVGNAAAYLSTTLSSGQIFVGSAGNVATGVAMSGGATISNTGVVSLTNASVTGQALTGFSSGAGTVAATDSILQGFNKLAGNQAGFLPIAGTGLIEESDGHIIAPANYTYVVVQRATYAFTINSVDLQTSAGTITAALKINGVNVTSCNGIAVTSTPGLTACTAANSVSVGDQVTLVTSANAASADLSFTVKETR